MSGFIVAQRSLASIFDPYVFFIVILIIGKDISRPIWLPCKVLGRLRVLVRW